MRRKRAKRRAHSLTKEVEFFSICTNDSFPDTLDVDRTYQTVAGLSCMPCRLPLFASGQSGPRATDLVNTCGPITMGGERPVSHEGTTVPSRRFAPFAARSRFGRKATSRW